MELWAWQEGARLVAFPAQCGCVSAVLFLHAGGRFLTAGEDGKASFQRVCGFRDTVAKVGLYSSNARACGEGPGGTGMVREKSFGGRCHGVGHTVEVSTFKLFLHPRLSYGQDSWAGPGVAWALFLFLLHSLWLSTQTVTR